MDNFDLKKYLAENKLTANSRLNEEEAYVDPIKKEENDTLTEGRIHKLKLFGLVQSEDGRFHGKDPDVFFEASNLKMAEKLADEYTDGGYSKYKGGFYKLQPSSFKIYK